MELSNTFSYPCFYPFGFEHPLSILSTHETNKRKAPVSHPVVSLGQLSFTDAEIWSGLMIYWANDEYRIGWGDTTLLQFFPTSFYQTLHLPFRLAEGMSLH
jgi:hypothetical protein